MHVTQRVSAGGAGRALGFLMRSLTGFEHRVLALDPWPGEAEAHRELAAADLVQLHFWNTPELYGLLARDLPPMRLVLMPHVGGASAPHVLTRELVDHVDEAVAVSEHTLGIAGLENLPVIPATGGWERLDGIERIPHAGFNVGYVGTVDFAKMHPDYVAMSAAVDVPHVRFPVCGAGRAYPAIAGQADELGVTERFEFRGWVDDVRPVLGTLDVFGYPLCEDNYSAAELVLQEAMYAGVPPVVLPYGGAARVVDDGRTGMVAGDEDDYLRCVEALHRSPALRERLGSAAREHARRAWAPERIAARWRRLYEGLLARPKTERPPLFAGLEGAALFVRTLGDAAPQFERSLVASDAGERLEAEQAIAASSPVLLSASTGGLLHYRRHFPDDPDLNRWAALVLLRGARAAA